MRFAVLASFILAALATIAPASATEAAWSKLANGGHTILLRHAIAPGTGDPAGFKLDDCSTQRNLSAEGRTQAQRIGARIAARGIRIERVLTSQWCRARDTATLAFGRTPISEEPALNSFFSDRSTEPQQTEAVRKLIVEFNGAGNQVMVTHQVNITALTGIVPREGEAVIVDANPDGSLAVIGRIIIR
ncbi:MAG: histidine phosphatase family protein [Rhizobiaceae bacterium]|jgi:phosphohistidine phosphatase SixA|nr:histidine phosphatase family protein [Rhizobiaceae bacterium]